MRLLFWGLCALLGCAKAVQPGGVGGASVASSSSPAEAVSSAAATSSVSEEASTSVGVGGANGAASSVSSSTTGTMGCGAPNLPPSDDCGGVSESGCDALQASWPCALPHNYYVCAAGEAPPVAGCVDLMVTSSGYSYFCCSTLACVRYASSDAFCASHGLPHAYSCPAGSQPSLPSGCSQPASSGAWCCP